MFTHTAICRNILKMFSLLALIRLLNFCILFSTNSLPDESQKAEKFVKLLCYIYFKFSHNKTYTAEAHYIYIYLHVQCSPACSWLRHGDSCDALSRNHGRNELLYLLRCAIMCNVRHHNVRVQRESRTRAVGVHSEIVYIYMYQYVRMGSCLRIPRPAKPRKS